MSKFVQKRGFTFRKPSFYPLNYGDVDAEHPTLNPERPTPNYTPCFKLD